MCKLAVERMTSLQCPRTEVISPFIQVFRRVSLEASMIMEAMLYNGNCMHLLGDWSLGFQLLSLPSSGI